MLKGEKLWDTRKKIFPIIRKSTHCFRDFYGRNNRRQILFNASESLSFSVLSRPRQIEGQFYERHRENVEVSHCWTKSYRRRRGMIRSKKSAAKKHRNRTLRRQRNENDGKIPTSEVSSKNSRAISRKPRDPSLAFNSHLSRHVRGVQFLQDIRECLLTLNSPPQPSSSSKRYPSMAGPLCPAQPIIPWPGGGCQATVTLLFSALHSSGISKGAPGAGNAYVETV